MLDANEVRRALAVPATLGFDRRAVLLPDARDAAVVVPLTFEPEGVFAHLVVRASTLRDHAGEVGFPGGKVDPGETLEQAALRELEEEVGVARGDVEVLGTLSPTPVITRRFLLHPFVGALPARPRITSPELAELHAVPLARWIDEGEPIAITPTPWRGHELVVPFFPIAGHVLYGASAVIFFELLARVSGGRLVTRHTTERPWGDRYGAEDV